MTCDTRGLRGARRPGRGALLEMYGARIEADCGMPLFEAVRLAVRYSSVRQAAENLRVPRRAVVKYMQRHAIAKPHREVVLP